MKLNLCEFIGNDDYKEYLMTFFEKIEKYNKHIDYEFIVVKSERKEELYNKYYKGIDLGECFFRVLRVHKEKKIFIFFDEGEPLKSISWLIAYEVSYLNLKENEFISFVLGVNREEVFAKYKIKTNNDYNIALRNKEFHKDLLEFRVSNEFATNIVKENYNMCWWLDQLNK